jgi:hypothetical protein
VIDNEGQSDAIAATMNLVLEAAERAARATARR